jgi:hypothetical protein
MEHFKRGVTLLVCLVCGILFFYAAYITGILFMKLIVVLIGAAILLAIIGLLSIGFKIGRSTKS